MSVNDEITLQINPNLFYHQTGIFPKEGDLLYFPMDKALFEITWCTPRDQFYQNGVLSISKIQAQKFIYSHEKIIQNIENSEIQSDLYDLDTNELTQLETEDLEQLFGLQKKLENTNDIYNNPLSEDKQIHNEFQERIVNISPINGRTNQIVEFLED